MDSLQLEMPGLSSSDYFIRLWFIPHFLCDLDWVDINILVVKLIGLNPEIMGGHSLLRLNMENIYSDTQGIEKWKIC